MPSSTVDNLTTSGALTGTEKFYADNGVNDVEVTATQIKTFTNATLPTFPLSVANGGTAQTTSAEMIGENIQACTEDTAPDRILDMAGVYDNSTDTGKKVAFYNVAGIAVLAKGTFSSTATLDHAFDASGYSNFKVFKLILVDVAPATDAAIPILRMSDDGGSTFEADASDYRWCRWVVDEATATGELAFGDGADTAMVLTGSVGNATNENLGLEVTLYGMNRAGLVHACAFGYRVREDGIVTMVNSASATVVSATYTDMRFMFSTGNIASGSYTILGMI
jgi:hypothetical protein